jgi:hypothetical protein
MLDPAPRRYTPAMAGGVFSDPKHRRAYIATKVAVFAVAALATWPLSKAIGPQAWWGLGVFALVLLALGFAVLSAGGAHQADDERAEEEDEDDPLDPDRPVELPIEDFIDLHPFSPREIPDVVGEYLAAAHAAGFREVRLIHGRGIGVQRERVRSVLGKHPLVEEFADATPDRGGWGATVATLREISDEG